EQRQAVETHRREGQRHFFERLRAGRRRAEEREQGEKNSGRGEQRFLLHENSPPIRRRFSTFSSTRATIASRSAFWPLGKRKDEMAGASASARRLSATKKRPGRF